MLGLFIPGSSTVAEPNERYLTDLVADGGVAHKQQWGELGLDTAMVEGTYAPKMRIGRRTYKRGLGHHAVGEILVDLNEQYEAFHAQVGVQWQGGQRGSVVFRVEVDRREVFRSKPMSDSDSAREVRVSLRGARTLRLVTDDAGDGISHDMANWADARLLENTHVVHIGRPHVRLNDRSTPRTAAIFEFSLFAGKTGPQVALSGRAGPVTIDVREEENAQVEMPIGNCRRITAVAVDAELVHGKHAEAELAFGDYRTTRLLSAGRTVGLRVLVLESADESPVRVLARTIAPEAGIRFRNLRYRIASEWHPIALRCEMDAEERFPPLRQPNLRPAIESELIEWDWRMQDGIGTPRGRRTFAQAIDRVLSQGDALIDYLQQNGAMLGELTTQWAALKRERGQLEDDSPEWKSLWRDAHRLRRELAFSNPRFPREPIAFLKHVPGICSIQQSQYLGRYARPGGGVFVLEEPGQSMRVRSLTGSRLPHGSYQQLDVSYEGDRALFAFCEVPDSPDDAYRGNPENFFHLYEVSLGNSGVRQLTDGPNDDFAPRYMADGRLVFVSTRRGGYSRCGPDFSAAHTLTTADSDGANPRLLSYHEIHEWDPAMLNDGSIVYTRWDYVDRHAAYYSHLWATRADGANPRIFYGNNTLNPMCTFEPRSVPGSGRVMATAGAHHAMTAGSIVLVDPAAGVDGFAPLTRLTPDTPFPETEGQWDYGAGQQTQSFEEGEEEGLGEGHREQRRWPGQCYRSAFPLSEDIFLTAYSFKPLVFGEMNRNAADMFGLYLVDRFGNKELLYRDLNVSSVWPAVVRPRPKPPLSASRNTPVEQKEGWVFLQNVYDADPPLPKDVRIDRLRVLQVFPKISPYEVRALVGVPVAAVGRQVLGTVPVEEDGSACFRVPAGVAIAFQALNERGQAVQMMRSITYVQPGETVGCVGCHEPRSAAPTIAGRPRANQRPASWIEPGPDGSRPISFPLLVQPVLDKHCVQCHGGRKLEGDIDLTGDLPRRNSDDDPPRYTKSYLELVEHVRYSEWVVDGRDFRKANSEPVTQPGFFGAVASPLTTLLDDSHGEVDLSKDDWDRLTTWMDANALFYGTFDEADQARQLRGERIAGPSRE